MMGDQAARRWVASSPISCALWVLGDCYQANAMIEDAELLLRYAEENSEEAITESVERRIGLVYCENGLFPKRTNLGRDCGYEISRRQTAANRTSEAHSRNIACSYYTTDALCSDGVH
jgi:hypothetical protein